jgi:hypothetical protein
VAFAAARRRAQTIYVGGEEAFCSREWTAPPVRGDFGALDRKAVENANVTVTYAEGPALVADHGFTTGQIGQASFEKLLSPSAMKIGVDPGIGCYADRLPEDERTNTVIPDQFRHETRVDRIDLLQSSRRDQRDQTGPSDFGRQQSSCSDRRVPPRAL